MIRPICVVLVMLIVPIAAPSAQAPLRGSFELPNAYVDEYYEYGVVLQGMVEPVRYEWSGPTPAGLEASGAFIRGTPKQPGSYELTLTVRDALDRTTPSVIAIYRLRVRPPIEPLRTCTTRLPAAYFAIPYDQALCARGGNPPYRWDIETSHRWIAADANGVLTGTPDRLEPVTLHVSVSDQSGAAIGPLQLDVDVRSPPEHTLELRPSVLPPALAGQPYRAEIAVTNALGFARWSVMWQERASGLDVDFDGRVARVHTDRAEGPARFTLAVVDSDRQAAGSRELGRAAQSYELVTVGELPGPVPAANHPRFWESRALLLTACGLALAIGFWAHHVADRWSRRRPTSYEAPSGSSNEPNGH
jgi:hypothetical protein